MSTAAITRPEASEYQPYFAKYVTLVPDGDIINTLERQLNETLATLHGLTEAEANTRHAPYTWSIKEVVGHLTDAERIFGYRALRFARGDATALPGFDENDYVRHANFDARPFSELLSEYEMLRRSHISMFRGLDDAAWLRTGIANGHPISVRALAYNIAGHELHHGAILRKRLGRS